MRGILLAFAFLLAISCKHIPYPPPEEPPPDGPDNGTKEMMFYVEQFDDHYDGYWPAPFQITMEAINSCQPNGGCVAGYCQVWYDGFTKMKKVAFDIEIWKRLEPIVREALVYHELGHCVLDRGHTSQSAISFMTPMIQPGDFYRTYRVQIFRELLGKDPLYPPPSSPAIHGEWDDPTQYIWDLE